MIRVKFSLQKNRGRGTSNTLYTNYYDTFIDSIASFCTKKTTNITLLYYVLSYMIKTAKITENDTLQVMKVVNYL